MDPVSLCSGIIALFSTVGTCADAYRIAQDTRRAGDESEMLVQELKILENTLNLLKPKINERIGERERNHSLYPRSQHSVRTLDYFAERVEQCRHKLGEIGKSSNPVRLGGYQLLGKWPEIQRNLSKISHALGKLSEHFVKEPAEYLNMKSHSEHMAQGLSGTGDRYGKSAEFTMNPEDCDHNFYIPLTECLERIQACLTCLNLNQDSSFYAVSDGISALPCLSRLDNIGLIYGKTGGPPLHWVLLQSLSRKGLDTLENSIFSQLLWISKTFRISCRSFFIPVPLLLFLFVLDAAIIVGIISKTKGKQRSMVYLWCWSAGIIGGYLWTNLDGSAIGYFVIAMPLLLSVGISLGLLGHNDRGPRQIPGLLARNHRCAIEIFDTKAQWLGQDEVIEV